MPGKKLAAKPSEDWPPRRFKVGDKVICKTGADEWSPGRVVELNYRESWMQSTAPYQVHLFSGDLIYVPEDVEELCQAWVPVWWESLFQGPQDLSDDTRLDRLGKLALGKDANQKDLFGDTLLLSCLRTEWVEGARLALSRGADPNLGSVTFVRPLHHALRLGPEAVTMLLDALADPNLQDKDPEKDPDFTSKSFSDREWHRTSLHYAAMKSVELTGILLQRKADPGIMDAHYKQPLHLAIEAGKLDVVERLLSAGADANAGNMTIGLSSSPLAEAAYRNQISLARLLVSGGAKVNSRGKQGMTALHMAVRGRHAGMALLLLELRADPHAKNDAGRTAVELAKTNGLGELAAVIEAGSDRASSCSQADSSQLTAEMRKLLFIE